MLEIKDIKNFEHLKQTITSKLGFDCSLYSDSFVIRRIEVRMRAAGTDTYAAYESLVQKNEEERNKLNTELSIHVTNFFRDKEMWVELRKDVIPAIVTLKKTKNLNVINVWSAGCSSGEEPLSIAMCFLEFGLKNLKLNIIATDLDSSTIEKAKKGEYDNLQFREMDPAWKTKYFKEAGNNLFKTSTDLINMIQYKVADIHTFRPKNMDLIFCRNTVIYFNTEAKSKLYLGFYDCLNSNGFFIMGKTEILQGDAREKFQVFNAKERVYVKE